MSSICSAVGMRADEALHSEVTQWMYLEAELLDDRREREWLENMVCKDVVYNLPLRETVSRSHGSGFVEGAYHLSECYGSLEARIARIETGHSWAEDPPSRTRHFVSNIRVGRASSGEINVRTNSLIYRTRMDQTDAQLFSSERHDVLIRVGEIMKLKSRTVYLDLTTIGSHNLAIFF